MPLNRLSHRLAHGLGGLFEGHAHGRLHPLNREFPRILAILRAL
jgi:hypothetical protein